MGESPSTMLLDLQSDPSAPPDVDIARCRPCIANPAIDGAGLAVAQFSGDGRLVSASATFQEMVNVIARSVVITDVISAALPEDADLIRSVLRNESDHCAFRLRHAFGDDTNKGLLSRIRTKAHERLVCVLPPAGSVAHRNLLGELHKALEKAASEWRTTVDAITSAIILLDAAGTMLRMNRAARELLGRDGYDVVGSNIADYANVEPWYCVRDLLRDGRAAGDQVVRQVSDPVRGKTWEIVVMSPAPKSAGEGIVVAIRDITERLRLEESVRRSHVMAALGDLVAGVAHEVRNPIFGISATLDALEASVGERSEFLPYSKMLRREVERLKVLSRDLLDYGRPADPELSATRVGRCVAAAIDLCSSSAERQGITIQNEVRADFGPCRADVVKLEHAFRNIVENAIQHSRSGQRVMITAFPWVHDGVSYVACSVHDEGPGFADEDFARIFEPFYSRRAGGNGLGLSIVQRTVEEHSGKVIARNGTRGGAVMTIAIPETTE